MRELPVAMPVAVTGELNPDIREPSWTRRAAQQAIQGIHAQKWAEFLPARLCLGAEVETAFAKLRQAEKRLEKESHAAEAEFLAFGSGLSELSSACTRIVKQGERLFALAIGKEQAEEEVGWTMRLLESPLEYLSRLGETAESAVTHAQRSDEAARQILAAESALAQALQPLVYIRTLFHIESAGRSGEVRQMFSALHSEIEELQSRVLNQFSKKFAELRDMRIELTNSDGERRSFAETLAPAASSLQIRLQRSFEELQTSISINSERRMGMAVVTDGLARDVEAMVVAMQAHDMVTQRVAHVRKGLQVLEHEYEDLMHASIGEARRRLPKLAMLARLEEAQLKSARKQLSDAADILHRSVEALISRIQELDEDCLVLKGSAQLTATSNGLVQTLLDSIEDSTELVTQASRASHSCLAPLRVLGAAASALTGDIDGTGEQMHRIAINTQLVAVQEGAGTGLEVLAGRIAVAAAEISTICHATEARFKDLGTHLEQAIDGFDCLHREGSVLQHTLDSQGRDRADALHQFRDQTLSVFSELGGAVDSARQLAAEMRSADLNWLSSGILRELESQIEEISHQIDQFCLMTNADRHDAGSLEDLARQYTMESERRVHKAATQSFTNAGVGAGATGTEVDLSQSFIQEFLATRASEHAASEATAMADLGGTRGAEAGWHDAPGNEDSDSNIELF
jgi:hypothetical protein